MRSGPPGLVLFIRTVQQEVQYFARLQAWKTCSRDGIVIIAPLAAVEASARIRNVSRWLLIGIKATEFRSYAAAACS
jgi:hypothetical protein